MMKTKMINDKQKKLLSKIFRRTGRTFQTIATEAGIGTVPDHMVDLSFDDAQRIIKSYSGWLSHD